MYTAQIRSAGLTCYLSPALLSISSVRVNKTDIPDFHSWSAFISLPLGLFVLFVLCLTTAPLIIILVQHSKQGSF